MQLVSQQISLDSFDRAYFIGIGGIGMSALARYFKQQGWQVGGYDRTPSELTTALAIEGIDIHFDDLGPTLPEIYRKKERTLVVYTPAIPVNHGELLYFQHSGFTIFKRAQVLGLITRNTKALCVAGTHGKTTTASMLAHILKTAGYPMSAFLGGISSNFNSNYIGQPASEWTVVEADEFDRSFLQLKPYAAIITTSDPDHLDIYGDSEAFREGFKSFVQLISRDGFLVQHTTEEFEHPKSYTYGLYPLVSDYLAVNLRFQNAAFYFDMQSENGYWEAIELGVPGIHNATNALGCIALCLQIGIQEASIREALRSYRGVKRRFEYIIKRANLVYIDDYAHHPTEIKALLKSMRLLYPDKRITGIFQPHLFSRTRDFFDGFTRELAKLDELILMPIYPAREEPIPGITSDKLLESIELEHKRLSNHAEVLDYLRDPTKKWEVILTIGAGDIDRLVPELKHLFETR